MEPRTVLNEKFFIVTRGKSRKGFCRGCIGRIESEKKRGEFVGLLYGGNSNPGTPKNGGLVRIEDMYPLTRHQAQLLLFISSASRRLELLCNPQLFSAICELSQDDLVVVKHKNGHLPGLVKNLMQIGRKDNKDDLYMLAFEVEFVVSLNRKAVTRNSCIANIGSCAQPATENHTEQSLIQNQSLSSVPLEVGSVVEVVSNSGITVYGVIRWLGVPGGKTGEWAGIELDYDVKGCSDGMYGGQRFFTCKEKRALFVPITKCSPDGRFLTSAFLASLVPPYEDTAEDVPPIPESEAPLLLVGKMKGIQGHINSCYLDSTADNNAWFSFLSLFSSSVTLDGICKKPADTDQPITCTLRAIVNRLRRQGFVPAESVMNFRTHLGCDTFQTEEKDPEEFITVLFQKVLCTEPLLKLRSKRETSQDAYTFQIFLEKEQMGHIPTVQQLMDTSCLSGDLKFETMPSCLIVQMPRFGNKYKMFSHIIPSLKLDITDLLYNSPRECFVCGRLAEYECLQCLPDRKLQPGRIKQYCTTCNAQIHNHPSRQGHSPSALAVPVEVPTDTPVPRHTMELFAVLCIQTSHYVSFVKYGSDVHSWIFFDSMADRCDDQSGYNIPEVRACPELGDFLSQPEEELSQANPSQAPELVRRLLCDSYMFLYQMCYYYT
uniref:ubiquitinyl hydrolase 1 n=1 Tax=Neolamprologus brichardi TaxID=32507 RepID=A0A3Q4N9L6_NEOBR